MAPSLKVLQDGEARTARQVRDAVASIIALSEDDRQATIPSGARLFDNRVHWAITYMAQAGLVRRPRRGFVEITDRGRDVLAKNLERIDNGVLSWFPEFVDFKSRAKDQKHADVGSSSSVHSEPDSVPPEEAISAAVQLANAALTDELLIKVRDRDPIFLEHLVLKVLTALGYGGANGAAEHLGRTGDRGLDGVIRQDALGLDRIYVQAKRYAAEHSVGRPEIQEFVGALHGAQADRGVFITTSRFTAEAQTYAERVHARVILIDGQQLARMMVTHNIGVQVKDTYVIKRVDEDFFEDG
ncbi:MAG: restriction endonuclease [Actinomycetota bacterium]|nr:restriction endonuclease [Actinomycetota bacterium]